MGLFVIHNDLIVKCNQLENSCKDKALANDIKELLVLLQKNNNVLGILKNAKTIRDKGKSIRDRLVNLKVTDDSFEDAVKLAAFFEEVSAMFGKDIYKNTILASAELTIDVPGLGQRTINVKEVSDSYHKILSAKVTEFKARNVARAPVIDESYHKVTPSPTKINQVAPPKSKNPDSEVAEERIYVQVEKPQLKKLTKIFSSFVPGEKHKPITKNRRLSSVNKKKKTKVVKEKLTVTNPPKPSMTANNPVSTKGFKQKMQEVVREEHPIQTVQASQSGMISDKSTGEDLKTKPIAKTEDSVFTRIADFFTTPTLARNLLIGAAVGLLVTGVIAGAILLTVGTAGIGPLVFGATTALILGTVGTGLSLGAIGLGIVGLTTAIVAGVGEIFRDSTNEDQAPQAPKFNNQLAGLTIAPNTTDQKTVVKSQSAKVEEDKTPAKVNPVATGIVGKSKELLGKLDKRDIDVPVVAGYIEKIIAYEESSDQNKIADITNTLEKLGHYIKSLPDSDLTTSVSEYVKEIKTIRAESKPASSLCMS